MEKDNKFLYSEIWWKRVGWQAQIGINCMPKKWLGNTISCSEFLGAKISSKEFQKYLHQTKPSDILAPRIQINLLYAELEPCCQAVCKLVEVQGVLKLVSVVSRILDTMRLVRHYGMKTTHELRHNWLDTLHLMLDFKGITINADSMGPLSLVRNNMYSVSKTSLVKPNAIKATNTYH